ncbi:MAG TPA: lysophospholipid acyltransferase family protein [Terriglobales bacterium]
MGPGQRKPEDAEGPAEESAAPRFSLRQRAQLFLISWAGWLALHLIGFTLRFSSGHVPGAEGEPRPGPFIYCFWHRCILSATYLFRNRRIAVMTSRSFDGEYIARIIQKLGYLPVRGSSSRGAVGALRGMQRALEAGHKIAFTIDGPRGPQYVAKPGPVFLARNTGIDIVPFYLAPERAWALNSWDRLLIPKPFSRIHLVWGPPVSVSSDSEPEQALARLQSSLEAARKAAEAACLRSSGRD